MITASPHVIITVEEDRKRNALMTDAGVPDTRNMSENGQTCEKDRERGD